MANNPFFSNGMALPVTRKEARRIAAGLALEVLESNLDHAMKRFVDAFDIEDQVMLMEAARVVRLGFLEHFFDDRDHMMHSEDPRDGTPDDPLLPYLRQMSAIGESVQSSWLSRRLNLGYKRASKLVAILESERGG
ncbi:MAG TPA: hypothetical protein PLR02_02945 [Rhodocyclaceae bacterium]|nr:hypothetical protein [Rhodocyclaceae bacterium]